jgi:peptidoglycan/xylan/chitin deacetylase (PgdA/CDA1 family)
MKKQILSLISNVDNAVSRIALSLTGEKKSLIILLFHGLFEDTTQISRGDVDPQQRLTVEQFRSFINYFLENNYTFVSSDTIVKGLDESRNFIMVTFDDGYYNNILALPVLNEFGVPAEFFISSNHVLQGKCFWWDVIYRERLKRGQTESAIAREVHALKGSKNDWIEDYIGREFGKDALKPIGDIDRPFTPQELREFSTDRRVVLGNHTSNHAILTNYSPEEIRTEIAGAQEQIRMMTGITPLTISYPNGNYSAEVIAASMECGLKLGIIVNDRKNYHPLVSGEKRCFMLDRFILWGDRNLVEQCETFRSDVHIYNSIKKMIHRNDREDRVLY